MTTVWRHIALAVSGAACIAFPATAQACPAASTFVTPSGNIMCLVSTSFDGTNGAECEIRDYSYTPPQKPADCQLAWGDRVSIKEGSAPVVHCHGDTNFAPGLPTLAYGQTRSAGPIVCHSEPARMSCTDSSTGHYLRLSREALELG
ncbi:DUF6636 domain-containing protein [Mycolicibacterium brisbanense]|uniref:Secreted protein n=1 Tax=Mycolicibacterium brisbanense TaxID=146020 RepID=A0A117I5S2_9MYCO|nr:DUF6636 domain-containing protein [Mycolicibacterium brisbanense]MCV7156178.1 hypothetical protein [Mycolicibacterium brisbanense]GAS88937.1 uncharacterized protein RMCB_3033 [Mycolicibacterium brisbanense]